jgi:hypothetical protein
VDATLMKLTEEERGWVQAQLAVVDRFVGDYSADPVLEGLEGVDYAWASWLERDADRGADDADTVINAVSVALGQSIVDALDGFTWVTVFQDGQTDLAVTGLPAVDALFFPAEIVALEYAARNPKFLVATHGHFLATIDDLRG